jgi:hypothetical protein
MAIMRNGVDVTSEVYKIAQERAEEQRHKHNNFEDTKRLLAEARASLQDIPAPWFSDCIWNAIEILKLAEKELQ